VRSLLPKKMFHMVIALVVALAAGAAVVDMFREPPKQITGALLLKGIEGYQKHLSAIIPTKCKFKPTCSEYAKAAIRKDGAFKGGLKSLWRIIRCSPLTDGGVDYP
jgi:uncharacterized protein